MDPQHDPQGGAEVSAEQVATWIDDIAEHAAAADAIAALGGAAVPALRRYLARGPAVIPQPRCFAVAMLARLRAQPATAALREVLRANRLHQLTPELAESESVVKNAAMAALAARDDPELPADVAFGLDERLRAAIDAAGQLQLGVSVDALVALLDDDVLAESAIAALTRLGSSAVLAIHARLDAWAIAATLSARRRIALLRALQVLYALRGEAADVPAASLGHLLGAEHPAVRAAAALLVWPEQYEDELVRDLVHGAVSFDWNLRDRCRAALEGFATLAHAAAREVLAEDAEPDLYGSSHPLDSERADWLHRFIRTGEPQ